MQSRLAGWGSLSACLSAPASALSGNTKLLLPLSWSSPSKPPCTVPLLKKDLQPPNIGTPFSQAVQGSHPPC